MFMIPQPMSSAGPGRPAQLRGVADLGPLGEGLATQCLHAEATSKLLSMGPHPLQGPCSPGGRSRWGREGSSTPRLLPSRLHLCLFERDFGLFPGEGPKTPKLANLASPQLRK